MKRLAQAALLISLIAYAAKFYNAGLFAPVGTDSLIYHLTIPAIWLQRGYLAPVDLPFHDSAAEHAPMFSETLNYLLIRLRGDASLVWIVQPVFLLLTFRLFYLAARLLRAGRETALVLTAALTLFGPFVDKGVHTSNNELVLTCGCAWFLYGVLLGRLRPQRGTVHACCGLGLMLATKFVAVLYLAAGLPILVPVVWRCLWKVRRAGAWLRKRDRHLTAAHRTEGGLIGSEPVPLFQRSAGIAAVVVAGAVGGFFYVRNWVLMGNPVYPAEVRLGGLTLFAGLYDPSPLIGHGWKPAVLAKMIVHSPEDFALTMPTSLLLWAGFFASIGLAIFDRRKVRWLPLAVVAGFPVLALLLYFLKVPFWKQHRLLFPVYSTLWLSAAYAAGRIRRIEYRRIGRAVPWALLALFALHFSLVSGERMQRFFFALELSPAHRDEYRRAVYEDSYGSGGRAWNFLEERTRGNPAVIGYAGTAAIFPLFGPHLQNRVMYVPVRPGGPAPIRLAPGDSVYRKLAEARRRNPDAAYWFNQLVKRHVDYLYLVDNEALGGVSQELELIRTQPAVFEQLYSEENVFVFRVHREAIGFDNFSAIGDK